jgi:hypothetical protein
LDFVFDEGSEAIELNSSIEKQNSGLVRLNSGHVDLSVRENYFSHTSNRKESKTNLQDTGGREETIV